MSSKFYIKKKTFLMLGHSILKSFLIFYHCWNSLVAQRSLLTENQHLPVSSATKREGALIIRLVELQLTSNSCWRLPGRL